MKKFFLAIIFLISLATISLSQSIPPITIREVDGAPRKTNPTELVFPNGSLTISGSRVTIATGGGGGSGTVTNTGTLTSGKVTIGNGSTDVKVSKITLTDPATAATITILNNKTFTVNDNLTLASDGTGTRTLNIGPGGTLGSNAFSSTVFIGGSGTANTLSKFITSTTVGDSSIIDDGTTVSTPSLLNLGGTPNPVGILTTATTTVVGDIATIGNGTTGIFDDVAQTITFSKAVIAPTIGPSDTRQHTLPNVASDTFALLAASQAFTNKSYNGLTINSTTGTLALTNGKTETFLKTMSFTAADDTGVYTLPTGTKTLLAADGSGAGLSGVVTSVGATSPVTSTGGQTPTIACATCGVTGTGLNQFASTTSVQLLGVISNETGSGLVMGNDTPTIITPSLTTGFTIGGVAASGTIPRGNGTNFVASAFTMAVPGASGNVLTSDGTNWTSAAPAGGGTTINSTDGVLPYRSSSTAFADSPITRLGANSISIGNVGSFAGLSITGNAAGSGVTLAALSSGSNEDVILSPKGTGAVSIPTSTHAALKFASGSGVNFGASVFITNSGGQFWVENSAETLFAPIVVSQLYLNSSSNTALTQNAAGVVAYTLGSGTTGNGWFVWGGSAYLASDQTNATATLASTTLSVTLIASRKYTFKAILYVSDDTAAEGVKADFGGGTATATNFRTHCTGFDTALGISTQVTSLTGTVSAGTFTGSGMIECHGSFEVNSGGTFIPRFAQNSHVIGTLTLFKGSHLQVFDTP